MWTPLPSAIETDLDLLLEANLKSPYKTHIAVVPRLMTFLWRRHMGKEADLLFTIPVGIPFWVLEEHEPLIVAFFFPIVLLRELMGPCNIRGRKLSTDTVRALEGEYKREWKGL